MSFRLISTLASGAFLLSSAAALAETATASADVNVRSGPGSRYEVIDRLPAGEPVNVIDCRGEWCEISMAGDSGFVARSYLDDGGRRSRVRVMDDRGDYGSEQVAIEEDDPDATAGLSIGGYYESRPFYIREGYYYWGGRWYARRPGVSGWRNGSWRRFEERRGPGATRDGRTNRPPRSDDRRARIDRGDRERDPRIQPMERRDGGGRGGDNDRFQGGRDGGGSRANVDRGGGADGGGREPREPRASEPGRGGGDIGPRAERPESSGGGLGTSGSGRGPDGGGRTPGAGSNDRGDRIGLDRAGPGGGGRNDR